MSTEVTSRGRGEGEAVPQARKGQGASGAGPRTCLGPGADGAGPRTYPGQRAGGDGLRTCPRCGAKLFADMNVCYGCLYDFGKEGTTSPAGMDALGVSLGERLLAVDEDATEIWGSLDELAEEGCGFDAPPLPVASGGGDGVVAALVPAAPVGGGCGAIPPSLGSVPESGAASATGAAPASTTGVASASTVAGAGVPRPNCGAMPPALGPALQGETASAADTGPTVDMPSHPVPPEGEDRLTMCLESLPEGEASLVRVVAPGFAVTCVVPPEGLSVGRDSDNGVSVGSLTVSRRHLRLLPASMGVVVQDLGATNPALVNGRPLVGAAQMCEGDVLELRGCGVTIRPQPSGGP